jgi:hypothetical protein
LIEAYGKQKDKAMTDQENEAKWCMKLRLTIKNDARAIERKRNLTDQDILDRVKSEDRERYIVAKKFLDAGVYQYK